MMIRRKHEKFLFEQSRQRFENSEYEDNFKKLSDKIKELDMSKKAHKS